MEEENENVLIGKLIDEESYSRERKHILIDDYTSIDFMKDRTGTVHGYLGYIEFADGRLSIDTNNKNSMYTLNGTAKFYNLQNSLQIDGEFPVSISSAGWYPDGIALNATGLSINSTGLSECFTNNTQPKPLDGSIIVNYPLSISNEPYNRQISSLLNDISLVCDKIVFICTDDWNSNGIKVLSSANPELYALFKSSGIVIPINEVDELSLFGSNLGGEIKGTATVNDWQIILTFDIDGHLDNSYFDVKHDGKATFTVTLQRNAYVGSTVPVTLNYSGKALSYNATVNGNITPQDGFNTYAEDYE